jgi:hypothetical protein
MGWMARYSSQSSCSVTPGRRSSRWIAAQSGSVFSACQAWSRRAARTAAPLASPCRRHWPAQPCRGEPSQAQLHRAACNADRHRNGAVRAAALELQSQNLTHASHRHSRPASVPSRPDERTDRSPAQRSDNASPSGVADFRSECLADLLRNTQERRCSRTCEPTPSGKLGALQSADRPDRR